jgi:acetyl-CoA C-acetyltransferase
MSSNPCIIGVATRTYRDLDAPEPLEMWAEIVNAAAADSGGYNVLQSIDSLSATFCQTWHYDDPMRRLTERLGITPRNTHYQPIGGTSSQQLVNRAAEHILRGEADVVAIASAEALATRAAAQKRGAERSYSFPPPGKPPFPWEAPLHPAELAHDLFSALNAFAVFDSARRAHLGVSLDDYRRQIAEMMSPMTSVASRNPDAWFPTERSVADILEPRADNRMTAYPYTKYMVAVMDVDMAASLIVASDEAADRMGVPQDRRVYVRGWCFAKDPNYIAEHREMHHSPAMRAASTEALRIAEVSIDDIAHFDLYSCFGSSLNFSCDALGIRTTDPRGLTVTGGLPYHGGPGSGYMTHSIAEMARVLRDDEGASGMTSGVGMINTKHAFGVYSTSPGAPAPPDADAIQAALTAAEGAMPILEDVHAQGTVAAYTVAHPRGEVPAEGILVVDVEGSEGRAYAKLLESDAVAEAERVELVGARVSIEPSPLAGPFGELVGHRARLH